jgi:hypothetical protein
MVGSTQTLVNNAAYDAIKTAGNVDVVTDFITRFNKQSSNTGYTMQLKIVKDGGANADGYVFYTQVNKVKK